MGETQGIFGLSSVDWSGVKKVKHQEQHDWTKTSNIWDQYAATMQANATNK